MDSKSTQKQVFDSIATERRFQDLEDKKFKREGHEPVASELLAMDAALSEARLAYLKAETYKAEAAIEFVRQIAGIAVRCLEHHGVIDRVW